MLVKVTSNDAETVINALFRQAHKSTREICMTSTLGLGKEMADHQHFTLETEIKVCFCDQRNRRQLGSNKNTDSLLQRYFPNEESLSTILKTDWMRLLGN
jgi:IS30 family transposase